MKNLKINIDERMDNKFKSYPREIQLKLDHLRTLIFEVAHEEENILEIDETLKWGEPSYLVKKGSTVRMDWKKGKPDQYAMYFKCTSKLVETFKKIYPTTFHYEGNRALIFNLQETVPEQELKVCIKMALTYHHIKHLPLLGFKEK